MPARKAASKKRKKVTVSRKKIAARKPVAKKSASRTRKKVAKKKVGKKSLSKGRKKAAPKRKVSKKSPYGDRKKVTSRKKPAAKKKATSKKKPAAKKSPYGDRKKAISKKKPAAKKKATKKAPSRKRPAAKKKAPSKKKPAVKKKATSKKRPAVKKSPYGDRKKATSKKKVAKKAPSRKRPVVRTKPAPKKIPPLRRARSVGDALAGPIHGVIPYKARSGEGYMSNKQFKHFQDILGAWKTELMFEVDRTVHHMRDEAANFPDPNDRATQESEFGLELRTRDRERKLLRKIDSALTRIDDGSYGFCEETGEEIGLKRLEARPVATLSLEAQERREMAERQFRDRDDRYR